VRFPQDVYESMMQINADHIDVEYVAGLARLKLSADEVARFQMQLGNILNHVRQLEKINISGLSDQDEGSGDFVNALRVDRMEPSLPTKKVLQNAPAQGNDLFIVPKIVE
jgi:aspartyl-tRNA(Asn)/glutamyl-tRNA(Gln) amidotransferase subunit C